MFIVYDKENFVQDHILGKPVRVYNVRDDKCGYPHFLIYEDNQWKYVSAKRFSSEQLLVKK